MAVIIQLRRGAAATWTTNNPVLAIGEMGVETDTGKFKVGDGVTGWNARGYASDDGADGATWHSGEGVPGGGLGVDGDYYLDTLNGDVYLKDTTWSVIANTTGPQGDQGDPGTVWYNGEGAPDAGLGVDGDYYLNTTNGDVYLKDTTWSVVANINGSITSPLTQDVDFAGYKIIKPLLQNYSETVDVNAAATGAVDIDLADGNVHEVTLTGDISALTVSNPAGSGTASRFTLLLHQGGTNESGTASAGDNDTLTDSTKSWDDTGSGEWEDWYVRITGGTGDGQTRQIASNTATVLTVASVWDTNPSTDSTYELYKAYSVTWPASVKWHDASEPTLSNAAGTYTLAFFTTTGGTTWYGAETGSFS